MRPARVAALAVLTAAATALSPLAGHAQSAGQERLATADDLGWAVGSDDASVTVVEFTDISCPYCATFHAGTRAGLQSEFVDGGQVRWITLSYVSGLYPNSESLSVAAECAGRQGHYDDFLEVAYEGRAAWVGAGNDEASAAATRFADRLRLDRPAFDDCRIDPAVHERLTEISALAETVGVRGTPTWFVDGFLVMGDLPLGYARQFIETRLPGRSGPG